MKDKITITAEKGNLVVKTPFSWDFVNAIDNDVPSTSKMFDRKRKVWILDPNYSDWPKNTIMTVYSEDVLIPKTYPASKFMLDKTFNILYLGASKQRQDGSVSSYGYNESSSNWDVVFDEKILLEWFDLPETSNSKSSLYAILGIKRTNDKDYIKKGFWRMAKQWHPDHCTEPDAEEIFKRINAAYQTLSSDNLRARYNAGLVLESTLDNQYDTSKFRPPLRCGCITTDCDYVAGRYHVKQIKRWIDIVNSENKTLVTSWSRYDSNFVTRWI